MADHPTRAMPAEKEKKNKKARAVVPRKRLLFLKMRITELELELSKLKDEKKSLRAQVSGAKQVSMDAHSAV